MSASISFSFSPDQLAALLEEASFAYHNGLPSRMSDAEYDAAVETLATMDPKHPFLSKVGAPVLGDEVALPIPLPSLNKLKEDDGTLEKWLSRNPCKNYHISVKLDGVSALWIPEKRKLYTRGDGMRGRDISMFAPYFHNIPLNGKKEKDAGITAIRGELIMRSDSSAIPPGKLARNIVAGAVNRKEVDKSLFAEIHFVAYAVEEPATLKPLDAFVALSKAGYEVAQHTIVPTNFMKPSSLSELFTEWEAKSKYQIDGIVIAPNQERSENPVRAKKGSAVNPPDRAAWKTRVSATTATTTVRVVEWNVASSGYLIPRVLFDTVTLSGAKISAATGLHGQWIFENKVGPGARIEVKRAGDVIPQIVAVLEPSPDGPSMPPTDTWEFVSDVHIKSIDTETPDAICARLVHALSTLGSENVGPGLVTRLYAAGFRSLRDIYAASASDFASRVDGVKEKGGERIYNGLRAGKDKWSEISLVVASSTMPRGIGHRKLTPLFQINPNPAKWSVAEFVAASPAGISETMIQEVVANIPAYLKWKKDNFGDISLVPSVVSSPPTSSSIKTEDIAVIVLTGFRDKGLEAALTAKGHNVADSVTKKTTHVVYPDGPEPSSTKITKGREYGAHILSLSDLKELFLDS